MKVVIQANKTEEFVDSLRSLLRKIKKEKGCLDFGLYKYLDKEHTFCLVGEWETIEAMENHFRTPNFEVLLGAVSVLGKNYHMIISEVLEKGGPELAKSKLKPLANNK
jgi:quinol monooxygenase YgiN